MRALSMILLFLFLGCVTLAGAEERSNTKIKAVATFSVIGDFVKKVGGDKVELTTLVGANGDAHTFEPTPQDSIVIAQAQIIFENGLHFEHWLDKMYQSSASKGMRVLTCEGIEPIEMTENGFTETDPHVWHDVSNAMVMVEQIKDGLIKVDQSNADYYKKNADQYLEQLGQLNLWIIDALKDLSDEQRQLVTSHDTFGYFAKRYGFKIIGAGVESATTEAADPSARDIALLVDKIKSAKVKTIFAENMHNSKLLQSIAKEAGVNLAPALYTDALGAEDSDGGTYIAMMQHNVKVIAEALK